MLNTFTPQDGKLPIQPKVSLLDNIAVGGLLFGGPKLYDSKDVNVSDAAVFNPNTTVDSYALVKNLSCKVEITCDVAEIIKKELITKIEDAKKNYKDKFNRAYAELATVGNLNNDTKTDTKTVDTFVKKFNSAKSEFINDMKKEITLKTKQVCKVHLSNAADQKGIKADVFDGFIDAMNPSEKEIIISVKTWSRTKENKSAKEIELKRQHINFSKICITNGGEKACGSSTQTNNSGVQIAETNVGGAILADILGY